MVPGHEFHVGLLEFFFIGFLIQNLINHIMVLGLIDLIQYFINYVVNTSLIDHVVGSIFD